LKEYGTFKRTDIVPPFLVTATTTEEHLFAADQLTQEIPVFYIGVEVRDMGTASYVAIGIPGAVGSRLSFKNAYMEFEAPKNRYLNAAKLMIVSDTNDAVIEVTGVYMDEP
jgi:hypothetical protein